MKENNATAIGCHTPIVTSAVFEKLKSLGCKPEDLSWSNDEGDSIKINDSATVWIPNPKVYNHFGYVPYKTTFTDKKTNESYVDEYDWDKEQLFKNETDLFDFLTKGSKRNKT